MLSPCDGFHSITLSGCEEGLGAETAHFVRGNPEVWLGLAAVWGSPDSDMLKEWKDCPVYAMWSVPLKL